MLLCMFIDFHFFFFPVVATEEVVTAESVDGAIQQVVSSGGQQVIYSDKYPLPSCEPYSKIDCLQLSLSL